MSSRARRSRSENLSPALFPFLAVLVCTMGALVLILVIVVSQASASAKVTMEANEDALLEASDMVEVAAEEMKAQRKKQQEAVDNRRAQLAAIEDHITRLMNDLKQLQQTSKAILDQSNRTDQQRADQSEQMRNVEAKLRSEQTKLDELESKSDNAMPAFAILPYQGSRGTTRRPIYLECTQSGVTIQPEGIVISIEDLKPPHGPGNPLDASLRLIRTAYQRLDPTASSGVSPYPLLLVRPDGIKAYVLARAAMSGWDDQFGYELIDQAMPLAFPPSIPGMARQLDQNLEVARQRQVALIAAMPRRYATESDWDAALDSIDQGSDFGGSGSAQRPRISSGTDWTSIDSSIASSSGQGDWKMIAELPKQSGGGYSPAKGGSNQDKLSLGQSPSNGSSNMPTTSGTTAQDVQRMQQVAQQGALESVGALNANGSNDSWQDPVTGDGTSSDPNQLNGVNGTNPASSLGSNQTASQSGSSPTPSAQSPNAFQTAGSNSSSSQRNSMNFSTSPTDPASQDSNQSVTPDSERNPPNASPTVDLSPRSSNQRPPKDSKTSSSPAVRTWSSTRRQTNGTLVSRPMTIVVMSDRWLVMRDGATQQVESVIPLKIGPSAAGQQLEKAIESRVESWGVAVANGYWHPKLTIEYGPDSAMSVQRLQKILDGSGLEMEFKQLR